MRNCIFDKYLRSNCTHRHRRLGFSLAELVISIGILLLMMALAGQVMSITVRSTGQAVALTEITQSLRTLEQTLRDDLAAVQPGKSLMLIQGNPINAYWQQSGKDADVNNNPANGYPHALELEREDPNQPGVLLPPRADILMFFTTRKATNYVRYTYPELNKTVPEVLSSNVQQVVYGHAELGEYVPTGGAGPGGSYVFAPDADKFSTVDTMYPDYPVVAPIPAEQWHLARRVVHLLDTPQEVGKMLPEAVPAWADAKDIDDNLASPRILRGETDVIGNFEYEQLVLRPRQPIAGAPLYLPPIFEGGSRPFARSRLDETPPPLLADRIGHYLIPHCLSFKVEWCLRPDSSFVGGRLDGETEVFWIDPGDQGDSPNIAADDNPLEAFDRAIAESVNANPLREFRLQELVSAPLGGQGVNRYSMRNRFTAGEEGDPEWRSHAYGNGERPNLMVFTAMRGSQPDGDLVPEDIFPAALRITVDVIDDGGRLTRPIRHVMVIPVGR